METIILIVTKKKVAKAKGRQRTFFFYLYNKSKLLCGPHKINTIYD